MANFDAAAPGFETLGFQTPQRLHTCHWRGFPISSFFRQPLQFHLHHNPPQPPYQAKLSSSQTTISTTNTYIDTGYITYLSPGAHSITKSNNSTNKFPFQSKNPQPSHNHWPSSFRPPPQHRWRFSDYRPPLYTNTELHVFQTPSLLHLPIYKNLIVPPYIQLAVPSIHLLPSPSRKALSI
jgi:hypothetical protein